MLVVLCGGWQLFLHCLAFDVSSAPVEGPLVLLLGGSIASVRLRCRPRRVCCGALLMPTIVSHLHVAAFVYH